MFCVRGGLVAAVAALALVSCSSNDGNGAVATLPTLAETVAPPTSGSSATVAPTSSTVVEVPTTSSSVTMAPGVVGLSPDGPWRLVDSAPGVTTPGLVYELMPKLWAFIQVEETDQSTYSWTLNEADRPIIEAYLNSRITFAKAVTSNPINLDLPGWTEFYADGGAGYRIVLEPLRAQGQVADLDLGVIYRPSVLGDERTATTALISECMLDGGVFRMPDGSLAPGSNHAVSERAKWARMILIDGRWMVADEGAIEGSCV